MKLTALLTSYCIVYLYIELVDRYNTVSVITGLIQNTMIFVKVQGV